MAHKSQKLQFEIVAVLGLLALFTHQHIFWVAGLILALIDLPDFASPLGRIARGIEKLAGIEPPPEVVEREEGLAFGHHGHEEAAVAPARPASPRGGRALASASRTEPEPCSNSCSVRC